MTGATADGEHIDLVEYLPAVDRCRVYDAIVSSMIESATPDRESVLLLIDFAPGRIDIDEYREHDLSSRTWRRWGDVAEMVNGPADPDWNADREAIAHELRQADADYAASKTVSGETLRHRFGLSCSRCPSGHGNWCTA
jgi:hypothetical protein